MKDIIFPEIYVIRSICGRKLKRELLVQVERDGSGYIATCYEIQSLYGYGEKPELAKDMLCREIKSMYDDLKQKGNYSPENEQLLKFLKSVFG